VKDDMMWKLKTKTLTDVVMDSKFLCKMVENLQRRDVKELYLECGFYKNYILSDNWCRHDIPRLLNDKIFLKNYINCYDANDDTLLMHLCRLGVSALDSVKKLIDNGVDINHRSIKDRWTPLICACWWADEKFVQLFIDAGAGADVNCQTKSNKVTALMFACEKNHEKIVQMLLEAGADVSMKDASGNTALTCMGDFSIPIVKMLLEAGADINHENGDGYTLLNRYLIYSVSTDDKIRFLLEAGMNVNVKNMNPIDAKRVANILKTCKHL
jgi:ankyrin repeat protein